MLRIVVPALSLALLAPACAPTEVPSDSCAASRDCSGGLVCLDGRCAAGPDGGTGCGASCECATDAECQASVPECVAAACVEGSCFFRREDARCGVGTCDVARGCVSSELDAGGSTEDAGPPVDDGGAFVDAAPGDAGSARDSGLVSRLDGGVVPRLDGGGASDAGAATGDAGALRQIGSACTDSTQCEDLATSEGVCMTSFDGETYSGGYCSASCSLLGASCDADSACVRPTIGRTPMCLDRCRTSLDCRGRGYACEARGTAMVCVPGGLVPVE